MSSSSPNHRHVFEAEYPADRRTVQEVRTRFEEFGQAHGVTGETLQAVKVAVSEAYTNAVCHGSPRGPENRVRIRFEVGQDGCLSVDVWDEGCGFHPVVGLPDSEEWKPSGRGLFLIAALMDSVHFEPAAQGTRVHMTKQLPPREGEPETPFRAVLMGSHAATSLEAEWGSGGVGEWDAASATPTTAS
jgi:anti-sigma regulatory factor (Ser/Thr protein kinase)